MKVTTPGLFNGFPFVVSARAEDGQPYTPWDGGTVYRDAPGIILGSDEEENPIWGPNPDWSTHVFYPSKSTSARITVYGDGTYHCLRLTKAQLAELFWRLKGMAVTLSGIPYTANVSGHVKDPNQPYEANVPVVTLEESDISTTMPWDRSRDNGLPVREVDLLLPHAYYLFESYNTKRVDDPNAGYGKQAYGATSFQVNGNCGFHWGQNLRLDANILQVSEDEYWFDPFSVGGIAFYITAYVADISSSAGNAASSTLFKSGNPNNFWMQEITVDGSATVLPDCSPRFPTRLDLPSGSVTGNRFAVKYTGGWQNGTGATATADKFPMPPSVVFGMTDAFAYSA